jgi:FHS family glucose/mannose:H+ symporter-like MFS transporter
LAIAQPERAGAATANAAVRHLLLITCWTIAILLGALNGPLGVTVQGQIERFGLSLAAAGLIPMMMGAGRLVSAAGLGWLSDTLGRVPVMVLGCLVTAVGAVLYAFSSWWWESLTSMLAVGLGYGLLDVSANAMVADLSTSNRQSDINRLQAFFGVGSVIAPLLTAALISAGQGWEPVYTVSGLLLLIALLPLAVCRSTGTLAVQAGAGSAKAVRKGVSDAERLTASPRVNSRIIGSRTFLVLLVVSFVYGGLSRTVLAWTNTFLVGRSVSPLASMYPVILFNTGLAIGRFMAGSVIKWSYRTVFLVGSVGAVLSIAVCTVSSDLILTASSLALAGLSLAALFPTAVTWGSELAPEHIGVSTGLLSMAVGAGSMVVPWFTGVISDAIGLRFGILGTGAVSGLAMAALVLFSRTEATGMPQRSAGQ